MRGPLNATLDVRAAPSSVQSIFSDTTLFLSLFPPVAVSRSAGAEFEGKLLDGSTTYTFRARIHRNSGVFSVTGSGQNEYGGLLTFTMSAEVRARGENRTQLVVTVQLEGPATWGSREQRVNDAVREFHRNLERLLRTSPAHGVVPSPAPEPHHVQQTRTSSREILERDPQPDLRGTSPDSRPPRRRDSRTTAHRTGIDRARDPWDAPDAVFLSYSREDSVAVLRLVGDLRAARLGVWLDEELQSGEVWWEQILEKIRSAAVFVSAISDASLASEPCIAERGYAEDLGLPIVSIHIGEANLRATPHGQRQLIDYRTPSSRQTARLIADVFRSTQRRQPLPEPLPEPPPMPFGYILRIAARLEADNLTLADQMSVSQELYSHLEEVDDDAVRNDIIAMMRKLISRPDAARIVVMSVQHVLSAVTTRIEPDPQAARHASPPV